MHFKLIAVYLQSVIFSWQYYIHQVFPALGGVARGVVSDHVTYLEWGSPDATER